MSTNNENMLIDLNPDNLGFDFKVYNRLSAIFCAQLSKIAYWEDQQISDFCLNYNLTYPNSNTYYKLIEEKRSHTQVLLWSNKIFLFISFRGTEVTKLKDWWTDVKFKVFNNIPKFNKELAYLPAGSAGFRKAIINLLKYKDFYSEINNIISQSNPQTDKNTFPIFLTGHSLGAALSQLFMESLNKCGYNFSGAYHFAPPLAVSKKINCYMKETYGNIVYDIVNYKDYVPRAGRIGVAHFGKYHRIHKDGLLYKEKEAYIKFNKDEYLSEINLHSLASYLKYIKDKENTLELIITRSNKH